MFLRRTKRNSARNDMVIKSCESFWKCAHKRFFWRFVSLHLRLCCSLRHEMEIYGTNGEIFLFVIQRSESLIWSLYLENFLFSSMALVEENQRHEVCILYSACSSGLTVWNDGVTSEKIWVYENGAPKNLWRCFQNTGCSDVWISFLF